MTGTAQPTLCLITLGCSKNQVDAEYALGELKRAGFRIVDQPAGAAALILNTCAFIQPAETEAVQAIMEAARLKQQHRIKFLLVVGCLVAKYGEKKLKRLVPEIDQALPPAAVGEWVQALRAKFPGSKSRGECAPGVRDRLLLSAPGTAYIKIAEGCARACSYCLIPRLRGPLRSRPVAEIEAEAEGLVAQGVRELILVAQDTTQYGQDWKPGRGQLPQLLDRLVRIRRLHWIRILYSNPDGLTPALIARVAREPKICKYLDLPLQHVEPRILRAMGRRGDARSFLRLIQRLRRKIPQVALRTTLLSGFPGETEAEHARMLEFVKQARFDRLGVFAYSRERGTRAAGLAGQVPMATRQRRVREIMAVQQTISAEQLRRRVNARVDCLVEEPSGSRHVLGRTQWDAPEVDGLIVLEGRAKPGAIVRARITGSTDHDLKGVMA